MTMSGIHSLAVLGGGLAVAVVVWIGWVALGAAPRPLLNHEYPETITGTGLDELAAMVDLAIRLDERRVSRSYQPPLASPRPRLRASAQS